LVEIWRDGIQIVGANRQTSPLASTICGDLAVGIAPDSLGLGAAALLLDQQRIATQPPPNMV
jgi:hypothetical protein